MVYIVQATRILEHTKYHQYNVKHRIYILKIKIENNSTWEGAFFLGEWVKINSSWIIVIISF